MFQKVVVPLDGSELAEKVLSWVRQVTSPIGTELILMQNIELSAYAFASDSPGVAARLYQTIYRDTEKYLQRQKRVLTKEGYRVQMEIARGDTAGAIVQVAADLKADLIAMTTHGRTGIGRMTLGSIADRVVRTADLPVLLVRAGAEGPATESIREILVPLDGSELSEQALPIARMLAEKQGSHILLLQAIEQLEDIDLAELFDQRVGEHGVPHRLV